MRETPFVTQFIKENEKQLKQNVIDDTHCYVGLSCYNCPYNDFQVGQCSDNLAWFIKSEFKEWFL